MAAAAPHATLVMVDGGSHTAPLERPDYVDDAVLAFLSRNGLDQAPSVRDAGLTVARQSRP